MPEPRFSSITLPSCSMVSENYWQHCMTARQQRGWRRGVGTGSPEAEAQLTVGQKAQIYQT